MLDEVEAELYLACLAGATPAVAVGQVAREGLSAPDVAEVRTFFDELTELRLMFREDDRFLALALPLTPDAEPPVMNARWTRSLTAAS
jgi:hypothetical protein